MATCMVWFATGEVQVIEEQGAPWLVAARAKGADAAVVRFGRHPVGFNNEGDALRWDPKLTTYECINELVALEGIIRITVNGEQVYPWPANDDDETMQD